MLPFLHRPRALSYTGSAWRILRLRQRLKKRWHRAGYWPFALLAILVSWMVISVWYPFWVLYRVFVWAVRRDLRKRRRQEARESRARAEPGEK